MLGFGKTVSIKIDKDLHARLTKVADVAGYATADEFVAHVLEKEMLHFEDSKNDDEIRAKLKGLGYIA
jgi:predicted transcriptional regulator